MRQGLDDARIAAAARAVRAATDQAQAVVRSRRVGPARARVAKVAATHAVDALAKVALVDGLRMSVALPTPGRTLHCAPTYLRDQRDRAVHDARRSSHSRERAGPSDEPDSDATDRITDALRALRECTGRILDPDGLARRIVRARPGAGSVLGSRPGHQDGEDERAQHAEPGTRVCERRHRAQSSRRARQGTSAAATVNQDRAGVERRWRAEEVGRAR